MTTTLRGRIVACFAGFAVLVTTALGGSAAVFLYDVEDRFFDAMLAEEGAALEARHHAGGGWDAPRPAWMALHVGTVGMPADLRPRLVAAPGRREFAGAGGRHYHVRPLADGAAAAWLVAEVSDRLVIRRIRGGLLARWLAIQTVILALASGLALAVARRITLPLSQLAESLRTLDPGAPRLVTVLRPTDGEVRLVAHALDGMRDRVAAFVDRERTFTRDASHELRTPLSVVRSATAQALDGAALPAGTRRLLERSLQAADRLERTIRSLLELAREDGAAGAGVVTAVLPVLEEVVVEQAAALDAGALTLAITVPPSTTLPASASVLRLVLGNVLGNACTHAAPGVVRVRVEDGALVVENPVVAGTTPGPDALGRAGVRHAGSPGYGLGLELATRVCAKAGLALAIRADGAATFAVRIGVPRSRGETSVRSPVRVDRHGTAAPDRA